MLHLIPSDDGTYNVINNDDDDHDYDMDQGNCNQTLDHLVPMYGNYVSDDEILMMIC